MPKEKQPGRNVFGHAHGESVALAMLRLGVELYRALRLELGNQPWDIAATAPIVAKVARKLSGGGAFGDGDFSAQEATLVRRLRS